jgi:predicted permease
MNLPGDVRYAVRSLTRSPVFAAVAALSLGLGIGANTAVFSLLNEAVLKQLPIRDPQGMVQLREKGSFYGSNTGMSALSYPRYLDFSARNTVFTGMLCRNRLPLSLSFGGRSERATGELVSGTYFPVLGVRPAVGRVFTREEDASPGGSPVAVLGYDYWKTRFGGDPSVIGREILANNHKLTVVGVAQRGFDGVEAMFATQIYVPVMMAAELTERDKPLENRRLRWVQVFARLKPGVSADQAKASLQPVFRSLLEMEVQQAEFAKASPYTRQQFLRMTVEVMAGGGGQNVAKQFLETPLWAMMGLVGLVLLIACANVANLMIARAVSRRKEMAIRLALGASRWRLVRQLLVESWLVAALGGLLGLLISPVAMRFLLGIFPDMDPPLKLSADPDGRVLLFNAAVSLLTTLLFGLAPAFQAARPDVAPTLKSQAGAVAGGGQARWRKALVTAQVSLSLLLLISAGLFARSLRNLKNLRPGFEVGNLLSFAVDPTLNGYKPEEAKLFYKRLTEEVAALPSVEAAAMCTVPPLGYSEWDTRITVEGYAEKPGEDMGPHVNYVSPGFFAALRIPVYAGRDFTNLDTERAPKVVIVNQKFARHYFGEGPAVGRHIGNGGDPGTKTDIEIVGVVGDTKYETARAETPRQIFFPYLQNDWASQMTTYVRTRLRGAQMFPVLRARVAKLDSHLPVFQMKTQERQLEDSLAVERLTATLSTAFGVLATVLAAVGLYGVMAFLVARRTREIGIRMAMGALRTDVVWLVMREVLVVAGAGIAVALPVTFAVTRLLSSQLYGVAPHDPATIAAATLGLAGMAALAGYVPARRATRVDPVTALRDE